MPRASPVLLFLLVASALLFPAAVRAQDPDEGIPAIPSRGYRLEQNYPNPANPDTYIPFILEESLFRDGDPPVVTLRIVNMLRQPIAVPRTGVARNRTVPVQELRFTEPGRKVAYWDGRDLSGRRAPSGLYYCELVVDGRVEPELIRIVVVNPRRRSRLIPPFLRQ
jgi:hypothetical protein